MNFYILVLVYKKGVSSHPDNQGLENIPYFE